MNILLIGEDNCLDFFKSNENFQFTFLPYFDTLDLPDGDYDVLIDLTVSDNAVIANYTLDLYKEHFTKLNLIICNALTKTATKYSSVLNSKCNVFGVSFIPSIFKNTESLEISSALQNNIAIIDVETDVISKIFDKKVNLVEDRVGLVSIRILCMIINESIFALQDGITSAEDIDIAMKYGTNYPQGPVKWLDEIGADVVVEVLDSLFDEYKEERYRASILLKQYARADKLFLK